MCEATQKNCWRTATDSNVSMQKVTQQKGHRGTWSRLCGFLCLFCQWISLCDLYLQEEKWINIKPKDSNGIQYYANSKTLPTPRLLAGDWLRTRGICPQGAARGNHLSLLERCCPETTINKPPSFKCFASWQGVWTEYDSKSDHGHHLSCLYVVNHGARREGSAVNLH